MKKARSQKQKIKVAMLDDHQSSLDSYTMRLAANRNIEVVGTASYGDELDGLLKGRKIDVLILDINVPNSEEDRSPYPILYLLPRLRNANPHMSILIISMFEQPSLVKSLLEAGASGYILKEDRQAIMQLPEVVTLLCTGGVYLSRKLRDVLTDGKNKLELSEREREALSLAAAYPNLGTAEIGKRMDIVSSTVRNLLSKSYRRLGVRTRAAAVAQARKLGLISPMTDEPPKTDA
jgi:DNA-binding NarL/FixJ family response regulator